MLISHNLMDQQEHLPTLLSADSLELSRQLQLHQQKIFPPTSQKTIRQFSPSEAAAYIGIGEGYLRQVASDGHGPEPMPNGRRMYSPDDMDRIRRSLDEKNGAPKYVPTRRANEKLQVLAVMNFKGGSAKTTTSAHLAQFLALRGYRVLAIDLDPQASLSALLDINLNWTLVRAKHFTVLFDTKHPATLLRSCVLRIRLISTSFQVTWNLWNSNMKHQRRLPRTCRKHVLRSNRRSYRRYREPL